MKIVFAMFGKPKDKRILEIIEEYSKKISRYQKIELEFISTSNPQYRTGEIIEYITEKYKSRKIYLLDEDGKEFTSEKFAENYEKDLNSGEKETVFVIGPAEGYGNYSPSSAGGVKVELISLSKMAMQHDIAALVLVEQIYRAISIKNNLPYHRV